MLRLAAILMSLMLLAGGAAAQETRIAANVNDDVISIGDLEARIRLVLLSSQLPDNEQVRQRVTPQVMRTLIDEKLEMQEAKKYKVKISDKDVADAVERLEQQNHLSKGGVDQLLKERGIPRSTLVAQITAALAWNKVIEGTLASSATVSDQEVNETLARIKGNIGKPQSRVGEIFLAVDNPNQEAEVKSLADRLAEQIRGGTAFTAVAQQFSQSPTAAVGGDLGWVLPGELPPDISKAVDGMQPGQLSAPIRANGGYYLLYLAERRTFGQSSPGDATISFARVGFPAPKTAPPADRQRAFTEAQHVSETMHSCGELVKYGQEHTTPQLTGQTRDVKIGSLPPQVQTLLQSLKIGEPSKPVNFGDVFGVIMVCDRQEAPSPVLTREQVADTLQHQRLATLAQRYLRDLRRAAYVDMRV
jgi:peptidyl-prolyl cis-trans isomerase SurA